MGGGPKGGAQSARPSPLAQSARLWRWRLGHQRLGRGRLGRGQLGREKLGQLQLQLVCLATASGSSSAPPCVPNELSTPPAYQQGDNARRRGSAGTRAAGARAGEQCARVAYHASCACVRRAAQARRRPRVQSHVQGHRTLAWGSMQRRGGMAWAGCAPATTKKGVLQRVAFGPAILLALGGRVTVRRPCTAAPSSPPPRNAPQLRRAPVRHPS